MYKIIKNRGSSYLNTWVGFFILFLGGGLLYSPCFKSFFLFDYGDYLHALVYKNNIATVFSQPFIAVCSLRIVEHIQFFICFNLFGLNPEGYLILGMLAFAAGSIAIYYCVFVLSRNRVISFIACFLIIVHPLHLEKFGLTCPTHLGYLFFTSALLCYLLSLNRHKKIDIFYILALVFYLVAVFAREDTLTLPLFILTYLILFDRPLNLVKIIKSTAGFFIIAGAYLYIRFWVLGLWPSQQPHYTYNFFNLSRIAYNYKMFSILAFKIITNPLKLIGSLNIYFHNLLSLDKIIILLLAGLILYLSVLIRKEGSVWLQVFKTRFKLFLLGCLWYLLGLIPFIFAADDSHFAIRHVHLSIIGLSIAISIVMVEIHHRIYAFNRYLANSALFFIIISIFFSTFLISRNVVVDNQYDYNYVIRYGISIRAQLETIRETYPVFPPKSQIYFINFDYASRMPVFIKIFYHDESLETISLTEEEFKKVKLGSNNNIFVFKSLKDGKISDLTAKYRLEKE